MDYTYAEREYARSRAFESIWSNELDDVFADVARYYDRANIFATLGLLPHLRRRFVATMDIRPNDRVLDVCAGTNVIGIDLLKREPSLEVHAVDRSRAMQEVGARTARARMKENHRLVRLIAESEKPVVAAAGPEERAVPAQPGA